LDPSPHGGTAAVLGPYEEHLRTGNLLKIQVHKMVQNLWREIKLHTGFAVSFAFNLLPGSADKQIMAE
jgi:hypothetical protein